MKGSARWGGGKEEEVEGGVRSLYRQTAELMTECPHQDPNFLGCCGRSGHLPTTPRVDKGLGKHESSTKNRFPRCYSGNNCPCRKQLTPNSSTEETQVEGLLAEEGGVNGTQKGGEAPGG